MSSPPLPPQTARFGPFELDLDTQQLRKAGIPLRIQPQPLKVLIALISRHGEIVTREELRRELWGNGTFVDFERGLNYCVRQIRTRLGDEAQSPLYLETIPRRGYRFIAPIELSGKDTNTTSEGTPAAARRHRPGFPNWAIGLAVLPITAMLVAAGWFFHSAGHSALTERDAILITDFSNNTGETLFDGTLRRAVSVDLSQSPYLNIISDDRVRQVLRLMNRPEIPGSDPRWVARFACGLAPRRC